MTRWGRKRTRAVVTLFVIVAAVTVIAEPTLGQRAAALGKDPRNNAYYDDGFCYGHHYPKISPDWINPTFDVHAPPEVVAGDTFTVNVTVNNNFRYTTLPTAVMLNLSSASNLRFIAEPHEETVTAKGTVLRAERNSLMAGHARAAFVMPVDASSVVVTLAALSPAAGSAAGADLDLKLTAPHGRVFYANTSNTNPETLHVPQSDAVFGGGREWTADVTYKGGFEPQVDFQVTVAAKRVPNDLRHRVAQAPEMREERENATVSWRLVASDAGPALLDVRARFFNYHKHSPADEGHTTDWGNLSRFDTADVLVLSEPRVEQEPRSFLPASGVVAAVGAVAVAVALRRRLAP